MLQVTLIRIFVYQVARYVGMDEKRRQSPVIRHLLVIFPALITVLYPVEMELLKCD